MKPGSGYTSLVRDPTTGQPERAPLMTGAAVGALLGAVVGFALGRIAHVIGARLRSTRHLSPDHAAGAS